MSATGSSCTATKLDAGPVEDMSALARLAAGRHGFSQECRLDAFPLTENWTYRITDGSLEPAVLRLYRPGGRTLVEVISELEWMRALRESGPALVPDVITAPDGGDVLEIVREPLPTCFAVMFAHAPGHEPDEDELAEWFPRLGAITARLHLHARSWRRPPWFTRVTWDLATTVGDAPHWGPWHGSVHDPEQRRQLARLCDVVVRRLDSFGTGSDRFGLVHCDLRLANLLVAGDRLTVIDFDDCGFSWFMYDLACALTFNEARADVDELISAWVAGYREVAPLDRSDEDEIPTFLMLRRLMLSAYLGLRSESDLARDTLAGGFTAESCELGERYLGRFG